MLSFLLCCATLAGLIYLARPRVKAWLEYGESRIRMERDLSDVPGWCDDERA